MLQLSVQNAHACRVFELTHAFSLIGMEVIMNNSSLLTWPKKGESWCCRSRYRGSSAGGLPAGCTSRTLSTPLPAVLVKLPRL